MPKRPKHFTRDLIIVAISIIFAVLLVRSGIVHQFISSRESAGVLTILIAGLFYSSILTSIPATALFVELAGHEPLWLIILLGSVGSLLSDFIMFEIIEGGLAEDLAYIANRFRRKKAKTRAKKEEFQILYTVIGALIIASPLPDELGLLMMGLTKAKAKLFVPLSFFLNALGILVIVLIA